MDTQPNHPCCACLCVRGNKKSPIFDLAMAATILTLLSLHYILGVDFSNYKGPENQAKVLLFLAGLFFICVGLYWPVVYRWSKSSSRSSVTFSVIITIWFILLMYFIAIGSALSTVVLEKITTMSIDSHLNFISIACPASMALLWLIYAFIFIANMCFACIAYKIR